MKTSLEEEVQMLMANISDKAYIYKNGKVDIIQNGIVRSKKFPTNKDASLYLIQTGWNYV